MKIQTSRFGEISYEPDEVVTLPEGMLGFENLTKFIIIKEDDIFLEYLQSVEDDVAFVIADPFLLAKDYEFELPDDIMEKLEIKERAQVVIKTVVVIPEDITKIRTNLQAPIVFNKDLKKGMQIILDDKYPMRYEFYHREENNASS